MIDIKALTEQDKERRVIYQGHRTKEWGYIKSWNHTFIFVLYTHKQTERQDKPYPTYAHQPQATRPDDLDWDTK